MKEPLKFFIERTTPIGTLARCHRNRKLRTKYDKWQADGATGPMPNWGKQQTVISYIKEYNPEILIETGTYRGKMIYAVIPFIEKIYSIELDDKLCARAQSRYAGYKNIEILHGSSGELLPSLIEKIDKPCVFWLDAHYSGGSTAKGDLQTPIMAEMKCIFDHKLAEKHIILIDDARCFVGADDYPTMEGFKDFVLTNKPGWTFEVENDIIRTHNSALKK